MGGVKKAGYLYGDGGGDIPPITTWDGNSKVYRSQAEPKSSFLQNLEIGGGGYDEDDDEYYAGDGNPDKRYDKDDDMDEEYDEVGLYKLNSVDPQLESDWFQPLRL
jgi:hypothetical protein